MRPTEPIKLLWTGGWDSTFRLLQLLIDERKKVCSYYIVDPERFSSGIEIQSMHKLRSSIIRKYPHTESLFLPVQFVNIDSIEPDKDITRAFKLLNEYTPIGSQFEWLSRFCIQYSPEKIEIAVENALGDNKKRNEYSKYVRQFIYNNFSDDPDKLPDQARLIYCASKTLYQHLSFPIIHVTKKDMFEIAKKRGWTSILKRTWFCYYPLYFPNHRFYPCGNCITCERQMKYGFRWRIPRKVKVFQKIKSLI